MPVGPQLPPSVEKRKRSDESEGSDSDDSVGPQLPPDSTVAKKARVVGPSLPPTFTKNEPAPAGRAVSDDEDSSSDDDFGPALPSKEESKATANTSTTQAKTSTSAPNTTQSKRDEWMTMAPTSGDWSQRVDPTKLKNRKFNTGKGSSNRNSGTDAWHETPEEKQARLQREVLGLKSDKGPRPQVSVASPAPDDVETARRMQEYKQQRGPSLYDAHQTTKKTEEEDDPSARAFDREKDIAGGLQLNSTQRRDMMKKSSDFNSRFSSAKYL